MSFGAVSYLNARPLIEGLSPLVLDTPSALASRMAAGEIETALLPVAAAISLGLPRVGNLGIAAEGDVDSVLLFLRRPVAEVRSLWLDPASRTSRVLARLILREVHGVDPDPVDAIDRAADADAELVIGDAALIRAAACNEGNKGNEGNEGEIILDLAGEWTRWTGLPFVFAAWYGDTRSAPALEEAYRLGRERLDAYAAASTLPLETAALARYLRERIRFRIGPREEEGLARFLELSRSHGLL
ncbi:MAG: menaquinone biosynthetic enzyme MqnA/MqnD family protein [Planctomycetota bacterium]|jgi:predicted solute-binding protein